jgi:hypothetical protein
MAEVPLNVFKTVTERLTTSNVDLYTAPAGVTTIVLMAQITNITESPQTVDAWTFNAESERSIELVSNFDIPPYDAASIIVGRLVIPTGDRVILRTSANSSVTATFSILETSNE